MLIPGIPKKRVAPVPTPYSPPLLQCFAYSCASPSHFVNVFSEVMERAAVYIKVSPLEMYMSNVVITTFFDLT